MKLRELKEKLEVYDDNKEIIIRVFDGSEGNGSAGEFNISDVFSGVNDLYFDITLSNSIDSMSDEEVQEKIEDLLG